ncbi:MAG: M14 family metallopeptidase [Magnetospirillum sp. WYHS-4]
MIDLSAFSADYAQARAKFLDAAKAAGARLREYPNPERGPDGEVLAADAAWLGPEDAAAVLVTLSATHGVEGFCGSATQVQALRRPRPEGVAMLHVHALNPHGFAWLRRVTEEGIDLNRNFIDFSGPLPENPAYDVLADSILPPSSEPHLLAAAHAALQAYAEENGRKALEEAVTGGQYRHPQGLFYGGAAPCWSRRTTAAVMADFRLRERARVAVVDFHTGLGPFGYGEPICDHPPGSAAVARARAWFGDSVTEPALGTSTSVAKAGLSDYGWQDALGEAVTFVALEFGTYSPEAMFDVLRDDHLAHRDGPPDWAAPATRRVKEAIRHHFYPASRDWQEMVLFRSAQVLGQAAAGVNG